MWLGRFVVLVVALLLGLIEILKPEWYSFLDYVNLIFHEAGHVLFSSFGWTLTILGGSLLQVIIPVAVALYFGYGKGDMFSGGLCWVWAAQSTVGVAVYAKDARERLLPLLGDDPDSHDWWQLLSHYQALPYDDAIAHALMVVAVMLWLWGGYTGIKGVFASSHP